jgi:hypothetical protein
MTKDENDKTSTGTLYFKIASGKLPSTGVKWTSWGQMAFLGSNGFPGVKLPIGKI